MIDELIKEVRDVKLEVNSLLSRKKNYACHYPGCDQKSISSHSISKNTLHLISSAGHVIVPKFNRARFTKKDLDGRSTNLCFGEVGVDRASTFKGFCYKHDNSIFLNLDDRGIKTKRDIILQVYRTAQKFLFDDLAHSKAELKIHGYEYHSNSEFYSSLSISLDKIIALCEDLLVDFEDLDSVIEIENSKTLSISPFSEKVSLDVEILYKRFETKFPVALQKCFTLRLNGEYSLSLVIITPGEEFTSVIVLCSSEFRSKYLSCFSSEINFLNFVESVLMHDSEFYLNKEVVDAWGPERLNAITNDFYFFNERKFLENYDQSLFDEIRRNICLTLPEDKRVVELKKIYDIHPRDSLEVRHNRQMHGAIKDRHSKLVHTGNKSKICYPIGSLRVL